MAIDFPNSPTVGQIFTSGGSSWQWDGVKWVAQASTPPPQGTPNKLLNPFMEIDQAHEGAAVSTTAAATNYIVDGLVIFINAGTVSGQRSIDVPPGYPNSVVTTQTATGTVAAGTINSLYQYIEADDLADTRLGTSNAQTLALAFWTKSSIAGTYGGSLRNAAGTRSYVFPIVISAANTWQLITQVIPGDTAGTWVTSGNAAGMTFNIALTMGANYQTATLNAWQAGNFLAPTTITNTMVTTLNSTFQLGPAGLWVAPQPQPLLRTSIQAELTRCQRYYEKSYDPGVAVGSTFSVGAANVIGGVALANAVPAVQAGFRSTKRAAPTITFYDAAGTAGKISAYTGSWANGATAGTIFGTTNLVSVQGTGTQQFINYAYTADARL